jgi:hypothetical protein
MKIIKKGSLTLALEGEAIPLEKFKQAVTSFLELVESVSSEAVGAGEKIKWNVSVKSGSAIVKATPERTENTTDAIRAVFDAIPNGIGALSRGITTMPRLFNANAIRSVKRLATVHELGGNGLTAVKISGNRINKTVTHKVAMTVNQIIGTSYEAYGSIEGKLQALWDRDGFKFTVFDALLDRRIECYVNDDLIEPAIGGFRKRVRVSGLIQYNKNGLPISVSANEIYQFPPNNKLAGGADVRGIFKN